MHLCPRCKKEMAKKLDVYDPLEALAKLEDQNYKTLAEKQELLFVAENEENYGELRRKEDIELGQSYVCDYCGYRFVENEPTPYDNRGYTEISEEEYVKQLEGLFDFIEDPEKRAEFKDAFIMFDALDRKEKLCQEDIDFLKENVAKNYDKLKEMHSKK